MNSCYDEHGCWLCDTSMDFPYIRLPILADVILAINAPDVPSEGMFRVRSLRRIQWRDQAREGYIYIDERVPNPPPWSIELLQTNRVVQHLVDGLYAAGAPYRHAETMRRLTGALIMAAQGTRN